MQDRALCWLSRDPLLHVCMSECIRRGHADIVHASDDGVLLRDREAGLWQVSAARPEVLQGWLPLLLESPEDIAAHQDFALEVLGPAVPDRPLRMHCFHSVYEKKQPLTVPLPPDTVIETLDSRHCALLERVYTHASPGYITARTEAGVMLGAFVKGELAGFIGQHTEGAQGLLHVLPEYRRMGLARALMAACINAALARGEVPFGQIETHNEASLSLSRSLGLSISRGVVHWFFR